MKYDVKDMLEIAIENNDSLWEVAVIDRLQSELYRLYSQEAKADEYEAKAKAYDAIAINIKALRKHMLDSGRSVNAKSIETENTLKHIEKIIEGVSYYHD